ncbi:hypothetical protein EROM_051320 [Encephalitozoon romaleae SJ-2008]|uniref:Uncharacterized protein n=1 Tax=Encephalitozoon romaleae (strain SJ-2008) TaxID=1178016 RepID=I7ARQ7_ENCRO|nr:hypothetical protein EROM_051320 [Encephalitozoon romaleae SJ-2008]AFN83062.1 hypothetical protein EROM_051320 [Encephalitozoon romaleae SJ-2008]
METFGMIEAMRCKSRFSSGDYVGYKNYLRAQMRRPGQKGEERMLCKLESNLSKFFIFNSVGFLKSNLRILRKNESEFGTMYSNLVKGIMGKGVEVNTLLELRKKLMPCRTFVNQVDALLESPPYNFDVSSLKVRHMWNDIPIGFNSSFEKDQFLEGKAPQGVGYDADISRAILKVENKKMRLISLIKTKPGKIICINKKVEELLRALYGLKTVLNENLIESSHTEKLIKDTEELRMYCFNIMEFMKCLKWDDSIDTFRVPSSFKTVDLQILRMREDLSYIPRKCSRNVITKYLEELLRPKKPIIKVPFIPVLFDIARDYISYPAEDRKMSELFKKLHIQND